MTILLSFAGNVIILIYCALFSKSYKNRVKSLLSVFFYFLVNEKIQVWNYEGLQVLFSFLCLSVIALVNWRHINYRFLSPWLILVLAFILLGIRSSYAFLFTMEKLIFFLVLLFASSTIVVKTETKITDSRKILISSSLIIVYLSVLSVLVPSVGYEKTVGRELLLFQGVANHPQSFGVFVAGLAGYYYHKISVGNKKLDRINLFVLLILLAMSRARTGMLALALIIAFSVLYHKGAPIKVFFAGLFKGKLFHFCIALVTVFMLVSPVAKESLVGLMVKRSNIETLSESFDDSRGLQVLRSVNNINQSPFTGIGFALPSQKSKYYENVRYTSFGIPYGVNTEKGFLPLAVVEETGILGFVVFIASLFFSLSHIDMNRPITYFMLTLLFANIGEMFFFSPGGLGLLFWVLLALSWKRE